MPTFTTPGAISATIEIEVGDIRLIAGDRTDTVVEVRPTNADSEHDIRAAEQARVEFSDGRLLVKTIKQRGLGLFGKSASVDVSILLPAGSRVQGNAAIATFHGTGDLGECRIKTAVGDIQLERTGTLEVKTSSGTVEVGVVTGEARVETDLGALRIGEIADSAVIKNASGTCRLGSVGGDLSVKSANGDIVVDSAGADVTATTANGDIRIGTVTRGAVSVKTAAGRLEVGVAAGTSAHLDLHTQFGNVHNQLESADAPAPGDETVEVHARSGYGDIVIRRP